MLKRMVGRLGNSMLQHMIFGYFWFHMHPELVPVSSKWVVAAVAIDFQ